MTENKKSEKSNVNSAQEFIKGIAGLFGLLLAVLIITVVAAEFDYEVPIAYDLVQGFISDNYEDREAEVVAATNVITVQLDDICTAYNQNEVAADSKFKGSIVIVSGTVTDISEGDMGNLHIKINGTYNQDCTANCHFSKSQKGTILNLSKGQRVTIKGRCDGTSFFGGIVIEGCVFK